MCVDYDYACRKVMFEGKIMLFKFKHNKNRIRKGSSAQNEYMK